MVVAREGHVAVPPVPPPTALRPFLRFAKLPPRALAAARRAVDDDDDFRARVRATTTEDEVGRAGWLWLDRPDGWRDELAALARQADADHRSAREEREERSARRRLEGAEEAARRAEEAASAARRELDEARAALADERRGRRVAESDVGRLRQRLQVEEDGWRLARERAEVADRLRQEATVDARDARAETRGLREELEAVTAERDRLAALLATGAGRTVGERAPGPDPTALATVLDRAADALGGLGAAVAAAAELVRGAPGPAPAAAHAPHPPAGPAAEPAPHRRRPAPLPPAVFDDSLEAADHLVRLPNVVLLVDGYNVSKLAWPHCALPDQRGRLVAALTELAARTGCEPRVVFDGRAVEGDAVRTRSRTPVHVTFAPPEVEADDVIIEWAARLPAHRPLVVASNDRRVREGARRAGANVVGADRLLDVLRR